MENETKFEDNTSRDTNPTFPVETNEKIADVLNTLVQINNDRIEGYVRAAEESEEADLKGLFHGMAAKSRMLNSQLEIEVRKYGGKPTESTSTLGKAFRVWMDFKAALTGKNRKAILNSCEFGEDSAQDTYADAIKNEKDLLPAYLLKFISEQKASLREDHNHVKSLRGKE